MQAATFGNILEAVDQLTLDEQESLFDILHKRIVESRRAELAQEIQIARQEFQRGDFEMATPDEIMSEILA